MLQPIFIDNISIKTGSLVQPKLMPVRVIHIENQSELKSLHQQLIMRLNGDIASRYPDREGNDYYAHITAEYNGKFVVDPGVYTNKEFTLNNIWILKDLGNENSLAYIKIK